MGSPKLRRLAVRPASRLGPEPWLSLVSVAVGLAAGATGGVIPQLAPNIAAPEWLVCVLMTLWLAFRQEASYRRFRTPAELGRLAATIWRPC